MEWEWGMGNGAWGALDPQCPMPHAQCPMPNAQCPIPNSQFPYKNYEFFAQARGNAPIEVGKILAGAAVRGSYCRDRLYSLANGDRSGAIAKPPRHIGSQWRPQQNRIYRSLMAVPSPSRYLAFRIRLGGANIWQYFPPSGNYRGPNPLRSLRYGYGDKLYLHR